MISLTIFFRPVTKDKALLVRWSMQGAPVLDTFMWTNKQHKFRTDGPTAMWIHNNGRKEKVE